MIAVEAEEQSQLQLVEREKIKDEEDLFEAIDKLTAHEINAGDMTKLQDAGIYTCNGLMMRTKKFDWNQRICEAVEKIVNFGYMTGSDALLKARILIPLSFLQEKLVVRITTGSQALNELLGGGIETSAITEAFGEFRSGKTQLAHTLCVSTQLPINMKRGNGKVAYIDTDGTFRPDRIIPIAERFGMDPGAVLENIIYARAYTYEHQYNLLLGLAAKMAEEPFRLLIVDSVIALFRVDFTGRGELPERQQKLAQMLSRLMKIAEEFNVAVYMTNQVIAGPGGGSVSGENCSRAPLKVLFDAGSSEETTSSTRSDARWLGSVAQSRIGDQGLNQENEHGQEEGEGVGAHEVEYLVREGDFRGLDVQIPIYLMTGDQQMDWVTDISRRECLEVEDFEELAVVVAEKVRRAANPSVPPFFLPKYQSFI